MKLNIVEIDGKTYAEVQDGHPVYTSDDGKAVPFDAVHATNKISQLNGEAKGHREKAEEAQASLKKFAGIDDPAAALKALETVANIDASTLVEAGKVEEIKREAARAAEEKTAAAIAAKDEEYAPVVAERDKYKGALEQELIGGGFARSKFISEKMARHPSEVEAVFGKHVKIEDGKTVFYDSDGNKVFSRQKPGDVAAFDEALEILVDRHPFRDDMLKANRGSGSGSNPGSGTGGGKTITRSAYDALSLSDRSAKLADGYKVVPG